MWDGVSVWVGARGWRLNPSTHPAHTYAHIHTPTPSPTPTTPRCRQNRQDLLAENDWIETFTENDDSFSYLGSAKMFRCSRVIFRTNSNVALFTARLCLYVKRAARTMNVFCRFCIRKISLILCENCIQSFSVIGLFPFCQRTYHYMVGIMDHLS